MKRFDALGACVLFCLPLFLVCLAGAANAAYITFPGYPLGTDPFGDTALFLGATLSGNAVFVQTGVVDGYVEGGVTNTAADVTNNTVSIGYANNITCSVYGGRTLGGNAAGNTIYFANGNVAGDLIGGLSTNGGVSSNRVNVSGGVASGSIFGGKVLNLGVASDNLVSLQDGQMANVWGGYSAFGDRQNNRVDFSAGVVTQNLYGGGSDQAASAGNVIGNTVSYRRGFISRDLAGGAGSGLVSGNSVTISGGGNVGRSLYGDLANGVAGNAENNQALISNGEVGGIAYGGYSTGGNATGNSLILSEGRAGGLIGGRAGAAGNTTNNYVEISGTGTHPAASSAA